MAALGWLKSWVAKFGVGAALVAVALLAAAGTAHASIAIDLRFSGGGNTMDLTASDANTQVTVQVWAKVLGANSSYPEGISYVLGQVASANSGGGAFVANPAKPTVGVVAGSIISGWVGSGAFGGQAKLITDDGIQDWGGTNTGSPSAPTSGTWIKAISTNTNASGSPGTHMIAYWFGGDTAAGAPASADVHVLTDSTEYHVADLVVQLGSITQETTAGHTTLGWLLPDWTKTNVYYSVDSKDYQGYDTTAHKGAESVYPGVTGNYVQGTGVTFEGMVVPEPATIALLGLGLVGLIRRRRA